MADMTQYQNKYRGYLSDDTDTYLDPKGSETAGLIAGGVAAAGLLTSGVAAFKRGHLQKTMHTMIAKAGSFRKGKVSAANDAVRRFSEQDGLDGIEEASKDLLHMRFRDAGENMKDFYDSAKSFKNIMDDGMKQHAARVENMAESELIDSNVHMRKLFLERQEIQEKMGKANLSDDRQAQAMNLINDAIMDSGKLMEKEQALMHKQTGFRYATIGDLISKKEINEAETWVQDGIKMTEDILFQHHLSKNEAKRLNVNTDQTFMKQIRDEARKTFLDKKADHSVLIDSIVGDSTGKIADMRDFQNTFHGVINSLSTDFTIPFVKINPMRMFYMDHFFGAAAKPTFHFSDGSAKNPIITGSNAPQGSSHLFVQGKVFNLEGEEGVEEVADRLFLVDGRRGPVARLLRNMSGISISRFDTPDANAPFITKARYNIQSFFDVGFQDEPASQFDLLDPTSWAAGVGNKLTNRLRMTEYVQRQDYLSEAFGKDTDFIYMRRFKTLNESDGYKDWLGQFTAGRENMDNVTMATLFPYGFFERLNATLNQVNLGLSNKAMGDAYSVFGGLLMKRIAPIWAGIELWDYLNYESENFVGFQFEDRFAQMYANSSVEFAKLRDNLGITDWAKGVAPLLVGGEHIADIPVLGDWLKWNQSEEETQDFWENGEVAVRKGRWWPLGNTPYTGSTIDYYQPNWVRRTLADVEYTDSQYGSMEEYFQNSWMPTLRHPFAPIRHFLTDPYHWEEKHYQDRPYMVTGGIAEFQNFPLIGPVLNSTIGQILKPQKMMHAEAWTGSSAVVGEGMNQLEGVPIQVDGEGNTSVALPGLQAPADDMEEEIEYDESISMPAAKAPVGVPSIESVPGSQITQEAINKVLAAYSTSSGAVNLLETGNSEEIMNVQGVIGEKSPMSTGMFQRVRMQNESAVAMDEVAPDTVASVSQMVGNLHYNMSEMGGFYGFMGVSMTGELFDEAPVIQSSAEISSYSRGFWDMDMGGMGGDANEIWRRFVTKDRRQEDINLVENTMPDWLPGRDYFIDFQTGDPYVKVKKGEMRLPGGGYEAINNIDANELMQMDIGASFIGYDDQTVRDHMLRKDAYKEEAFLQILNRGSKWHKSWESEMNKKGIAVATEQYVEDKENNIGGFYDVLADHEKLMKWMNSNQVEFTYYSANQEGTGDEQYQGFFNEGVKISDMNENDQQAFYDQLVATSDTAIIDPKTRGTKAWENDEMHFENVQQVNFYASNVGTPINYLIHVDRMKPEKGIKVFAFEQNEALLDYSKAKVENVRAGIRQDIDEGDLHRSDLYEIVDRYRVLADVAPYSNEFRSMKSQIPNMGLKEEEMEEIREINDQVIAKKKKNRFYDYRFKTANVDEKLVTVDQVIDNNTFTVKEHPDNPIKLAGVRVSNAKDNPIADQAGAMIGQTIHEGAKIRIAYDSDEEGNPEIKRDTYKSIQAVVYDQNGRNLNLRLINEELGKEKENDYSAAGVHARFSPTEISFGALWERFAHMDTVLHTKLLQVRSPLESYERREVYGKDWQEWTDPIDDFLIPAIENATTHNPLLAIAGGGLVGAAFGSLKPSDIGGEGVSRYGKIVGGFIGASVMGLAVLNKMSHEFLSGDAWIPERREKERATEEYFDVLEYIKYNALYNKYSTLAEREEGFDVKGYIEGNKNKGENNKKRIAELEKIKQQLYLARPNEQKGSLVELKKLGIKSKNKEDALKQINAELNAMTNDRTIHQVSPIAAKALMYNQARKQTMYGYEPGDPIADVMAALPKKDRDYLTPFINAPEEERQRIMDIVPNYMKRILQSAWGLPVDEKIQLNDFFQSRPLPGANWKGWREDVAIEDIKIKFVDNVGLDPSEFDIWDDDQKRVQQMNVPTPDVFNGRESAESYSRKLKEILLGENVQGVQVDVVESKQRGVRVKMDIDHDRRDEVQQLINQEGYHIL